jgi:hypothetical protein
MESRPVGNYRNNAGRWLTYAAAWDNGVWNARATPNVHGQRGTTFPAISCPSATVCMAAGDSRRGTAPNGRCSGPHVRDHPIGGDDLLHVSCVSTSRCVAVGFRYNPKVRDSHDRTLAEAWNGHSWRLQKSADE